MQTNFVDCIPVLLCRRHFVENDIAGVDISKCQMKFRRTIRSITLTETKSLAKVRGDEISTERISAVARRTLKRNTMKFPMQP